MNNIKGYDEFVNEELNWKDVKRFGRRVALKFTYTKARTIMNLMKILVIWSKEGRDAFDALKKFIDRCEDMSKIMVSHDMTDKGVDKMTDEELRAIVTQAAEDYEEKYGNSFIDDLKTIAAHAMRNAEKIARNPKKQAHMNRMRRLIRLLDTEDDVVAREEDPYGEEEWDEDNEYNILRIIEDGRRMSAKDFLNYTKAQLVGKKIIMKQKEEGLGIVKGFKDRFIVADVELVNEDEPYQGVILIDDKGRWHHPDKYTPIIILE